MCESIRFVADWWFLFGVCFFSFHHLLQCFSMELLAILICTIPPQGSTGAGSSSSLHAAGPFPLSAGESTVAGVEGEGGGGKEGLAEDRGR